jgi:hypothetical protein
MLFGAEAPEVPFWLQIAAVVLSPLGAVAGVLFGARWSARAEERRWLRTERRAMYATYLNSANELARDFALRLREAAEARDRDRFLIEMADFEPRLIDLQRAQSGLTLIASRKVGRATNSVLDALGNTRKLLAAYVDVAPGGPMPDFDKKRWSSCSAALTKAMYSFTDAARLDLGVGSAR